MRLVLIAIVAFVALVAVGVATDVLTPAVDEAPAVAPAE